MWIRVPANEKSQVMLAVQALQKDFKKVMNFTPAIVQKRHEADEEEAVPFASEDARQPSKQEPGDMGVLSASERADEEFP